MDSSTKKSTPKPNTIQQWEEAGTLLSSAVSRFYDLSTFLEKSHNTRGERTSEIDLIARIDMSLNHFRSTLDHQLTQARISLAKTRNRLSRSILSLPHEILSEIFLQVVYDPKDEDDPSAVAAPMARRVEMIYRRLHSLLAVCTSWRRVGIACKGLWTIVPFVDPDIGNLRTQSAGLSLQRAGNHGLNLAAALTKENLPRYQVLAEHVSRFNTLTISGGRGSAVLLCEVLEIFLKHGTPETISNLCLNNDKDNYPIEHPSPPLNTKIRRYEGELSRLIKSVSVLRLGGVALDWERPNFSSQLVTLQVGGISLGRQDGICAFISALSSASNLRELTLISVQAAPDEGTTMLPNTLTLPRLELFQIEDLHCNIFALFVQALTPGSYKLAVNLYADFSTTCSMLDSHPRAGIGFVGCEEVCSILSKAPIDKLIVTLNDDYLFSWDSPTNIRALLKSVPRAKTFVMNFFELDLNMVEAFERPPRPPSWGVTRDDLFPRLEAIEFHCSTIKSPLQDLKKGFEGLLASHPIQRMILGVSTDEKSEELLDQDDEVIDWLRSTVPQFQLFRKQSDPPELCSFWQLWDS